MHRRSFLGSLLTLAAALRTPRAWADLPTAPPSPPHGGRFGREQLHDQVLENLGELSPFRLLYLSTHPEMGHSHLVVVNTKFMRVEKVIAAAIEKRHSIVLSPGKDPQFALLPELDGAKASLVDLKKGEEIAQVTPSAPNHFFSGHAVFAPDGKTVFLPEFPQNEGASRGQVVVREVPSMKVVKSFDTGCYRPHNLLLSHAGDKLLVGHYGRSVNEHEPPSDGGLSVLSLPAGTRLPAATPENPYLALCHLDRDDHDNVFISTRSWSGKDIQLMTPVLFGRVGATTWESRLPEDLKERFRFNFSIRLAQKAGILGVAHIDGRMASFWDAKARRYLGMIDFDQDHPLGMEVTPDGRYFLVNTTGGALYFIDVKTRKIAKRTGLIGIGFCPHIAALPIPT